MTDQPRPDHDDFAAAVALLWQTQGLTAPTGEALARSANIMADTLAAGRAVRRSNDKTTMPMVGARRDIE